MSRFVLISVLMGLFSGLLVAQPARLQVIHNAADPAAASVDVYVNGSLLLDNFEFRKATPFVDVPSGVQLNIGVAPGSSTSVDDTLKNFTVTLAAGKKYTAIANGVVGSGFAANPDGLPIGFTLFAAERALESARWSWFVDLSAFHGATDGPTDYYNKYDPTIVHENMRGRYTEINKWIEKSDIIIIHFWNHPLLFEFLVNSSLPPCRIAFWSHISGLHPPYVFSKKLVDFSDLFVFSSPISYETKEIKELLPEYDNKFRQIWTTGDINSFLSIEPVPHNGFNIGCIGTFDYSKLHPNFVDFCSKINIPDVKFIMCGTGCDEETIKKQVKEKGLEDKFIFTGVIQDIRPYLAIIDVLGYPLNPTTHESYGCNTLKEVLGGKDR